MELYFGLAIIVIVLVVRDLLRRDPIAPPSCKRCKVGLELEARKDPFAISSTPYFSIPWFRFPFLGRNVRYVYRCPHCGRKRTIVQKERDMP